jgi:hypothetical protein
MPGQVLAKAGLGDGEAEWIDDGPPAPAFRHFGITRDAPFLVNPGASFTPLSFGGSPVFGGGCAYDPMSGRFIPNEAGVWVFVVSGQILNQAQALVLRIKFNGIAVASPSLTTTPGELPQGVHSFAVQPCNGVSDYFSAEVAHSGGFSLQIAQLRAHGFRLPSS